MLRLLYAICAGMTRGERYSGGMCGYLLCGGAAFATGRSVICGVCGAAVNLCSEYA
ncbi:hypothetical protein [Hornefia butyriciproducens]|uniref:hypothetical protein n=1 Tax=Hornefia butyriciproducens TaxID=2652293 RepID=UPI002A911F43|nr:hypothetical protein [Hornefia butyriciproducens]MDY5462043.1 hypothetical protein [Hornefia butyriciproducens]